jgi:hypothetical protein
LKGADVEYKQKRQTIEGLMDHLEDFFEVGVGTAGSGDGDGVARISSMASYPSVVELVRCLELCRRMAKGHYDHLVGFYRSEWRTVTIMERRRNQSGKTSLEPSRQRERVVPRWVNERMVDRALDFLVGVWDHDVVLELPPALTRKLRPLASEEGEPGWTEYIPDRDGPRAA